MTNDSSSRAPQLLEEGAAFAQLVQVAAGNLSSRSARPAPASVGAEPFDVIVIGAGQAGLAAGYHLARQRMRFVILNADARVGDTWRNRWDSLRLFTPARYDALPGLPFPARGDSFPTKDEMADYLEAYVARFALPVRNHARVTLLFGREGEYVVHTEDGHELRARQVIVAMANYQLPRVPDFASALRPDIIQLHSSEYRNPGQLRQGTVLIAGAGNSGAEIAAELARTHQTLVAGRDTGQVPFRIESLLGRTLLSFVVLRLVFHHLLRLANPIGRRAHAGSKGGGPLIRTRGSDLRARGVERVARVVGVEDGRPKLDDGRVLDVANVVWCTGFQPGLSFIRLPVLDEHGEPRHDGGVARGEAGLYFLGRHFLRAMSSVMIHGVGRDAEYIVRLVTARQRELHSAPAVQVAS